MNTTSVAGFTVTADRSMVENVAQTNTLTLSSIEAGAAKILSTEGGAQ